MKKYDKSKMYKRIAKERIEILFREAKSQSKEHPDRANRYVFLARKLAMKYRIKLDKKFKRLFCKHCYHYFIHGKNVEVRTNPKTRAVEYLCLDCKEITRFPYTREKKEKKNVLL